MIFGERPGRMTFNRDGKGTTASLVVLCQLADVYPVYDPSLPQYGEPLPGMPYLRCVQISAQEGMAGEVEVTAQYSTERQLADEFYETSIDFGLETGDCTSGWTWETAGTPVETQIPTIIPVEGYSITMRVTSAPEEAILAAINCVNDRIFHGHAAGTMRFDGANTSESYDSDGSLISVRTTYSWTVKTRSHNEDWRPPLQARDIDGNLIYYHNIDAGEPYYTEDSTLIATPVWVSGTPGTGGWDKMTYDGGYRYAECDFATVLGIPKKTGDE